MKSIGSHSGPVLRFDHWLRLIGNEMGNFNERVVEYPWVLDNIDENGRSVLDIGTTDSLLTFELIRLGFDVYGIDSRGFLGRHRHLSFCRADVCHAPFRPKSFDQIIAVSTLEHVGLGAYGDPKIVEGDSLAISEMKMMLKDEGKLILTTPFAGRKFQTWQRIYDLNALKQVTRGLTIERLEFFGRNSRGVWKKTSLNHFAPDDSTLEHGVACLSLRN